MLMVSPTERKTLMIVLDLAHGLESVTYDTDDVRTRAVVATHLQVLADYAGKLAASMRGGDDATE